MAWRLTAYGVANVAAGEALATIIETDGFTAVASLADERYDLISLLERSVGAKRYLAVAQGRIFNPMAAAVASSPLNGHKTQNLAAYTRALGAAFGTLRGGVHRDCWVHGPRGLGRGSEGLEPSVCRLP